MVTKNFLITGATSALGNALAHAILERYETSCKLYMLSRTHCDDLQKLADSNVIYHSGVDLLEISSGNAHCHEIENFFEGNITLIHSAGDFWYHVPFLEFNAEKAKKMMDSHYLTLYTVLQAILPIMISKGGGKILAFSCNATDSHFPNMLPFTAAKAAVDAVVKCIAHEYADKNIVANAIALSSLKTLHNRESKPFGDFDHYLDLRDLCSTILEIAALSNNLANGNVIKCYQYSDSYYHESYFQRIRQK